MTKLVLLALTLLTATSLAATGARLGIAPGAGNKPMLLAQRSALGEPARVPTIQAEGGPRELPPAQQSAAEARPPAPADEAIPPPEGLPTLLFFKADYHEPARRMVPRVAALAAAGYPIRTVDINHDERFEASRYQGDKAHLAPVYFVVAASGEALARADGVMSTKDLADFYNRNAPKPGKAAPTGGEPPLTLAPEIPRPWETAARLKIERGDQTRSPELGSGTIIWSGGHEALILTAAHLLHGPGGTVPDLKELRSGVRIAVDLFDGKLQGMNPARVGPAQIGLAGALLDIDMTQDLALIHFHSKEPLRASPLALDAHFGITAGTKLLAVGCSNGTDATTWNTTVISTEVPVETPPLSMIAATLAPRPGRSGGGLFTQDGYLVGICNYADPVEDKGLYTRVKGVHQLLERNRFAVGPTGGVRAIDQDEQAEPAHPAQVQPAADAKAAFRRQVPDPEALAVTRTEGASGEPAPLASNIVPPPTARPVPAPPRSGATLVADGGSSPAVPSTATTGLPPSNVAPWPRPWETVVRVRNHLSDSEISMGSGVVIASTADESIVLCCAHHLRDKEGKLALDRPLTRITVDLFGNQFPPGGPRQLACIRTGLAGVPVAVNVAEDFALIRIRPGRVLPAAPIAPAPWQVARGMPLVALGCSHGEDATARDVQVIDPRVRMVVGSDEFYTIKCSGQPEEGRSGGGLFTQDGYLVGICNYADPQAKVGLYREARAFRGLIECLEPAGGGVRFDLAAAVRAVPKLQLVGSPPAMVAPAEPDPAPAVSQERRLGDLERKLDRVLESLDNRRGEPGLTPFRSHGGLGP